MKLTVYQPELSEPPKRLTGLGDIVKMAAYPVARVLDVATGSNLVGCGGCQKRAEKLNALVPDITHPFK